MADPTQELGPSDPAATNQPDRHISGILEVPITWLDLTPPSGSLHLKLVEAGDALRAHIWSHDLSTDEQMAWARAQSGWSIRGAYHSRPHVVSFTVDSLPAGLAWLSQRSSYQHLELQPNGSVRLHLRGLRDEIQEVHQRLRRATEVKVVRVADAVEPDIPVPSPQLTTAQRAAIEAAYEAGFFEVPRETSLDDLAKRLGRSRSSLSTLLRRGIEGLVEHLLVEGDRSAQDRRPKRAPLKSQPRR